MLDHAIFIGPQSGAVIGGHEHQHCRASLFGLCRALTGNAGAEMAGGGNNRHASGNMVKAEIGQLITLGIGQQKLFGVICQNANTIDALVNHAIKNAPHPVQIEIAIFEKRCRGNWIDAGID